MRDVHRLREKIELSLDDRQVAALAVCALLLLGAIFTLGVMVGKRLSAAAPQTVAEGDLNALDQQQSERRTAAAALPVARAPDAPEAARGHDAKGAQEAHAQAAPPQGAQGQAAQGQAQAARTPPADAPAAATAQKDDLDEQPAPDPGKPAPDQSKPAPPAAPAVIAAQRPALVVDPPPATSKIRAATPVVLSGAPRDAGQFTVQVGASQDRADAQRLEARARGAGLKPYIVEARIGAATWYRVRVGAFNDKDAAARYRKDVERELRTSAMVMPTH